MKKYRLKITENDLRSLRELVSRDLPREAGAFALAGITHRADGQDFLVRRPVEIPPGDFVVQEELHLRVAPRAVNGLMALCEANGTTAVICHSHPIDSPYSPSDDHGERRLFAALRPFLPPRLPMASLLFLPGGVRGRVWYDNQAEPEPIDEILTIGSSVRRIQSTGRMTGLPAGAFATYDRQIRAFGREGQRAIAATKAAVIGLGGTGSPTAEQLVRLGVEDLVLVEPDVFTVSNTTRVYGTFHNDSQRPWWQFWRRAHSSKLDLMTNHLLRINPRLNIRGISTSVVLHAAAEALLDRDILLLCTDDHWGRSIVNQLVYQHFIPAINLGVRIAASSGRIAAAVGAVDVLHPDLPCLWCRQSLRAERIAAESMPSRDRASLTKEGYVEGLNTPAPSVISLTTTMSGLATTLFLQQITGFMGEGGDVVRLNYDAMDGTVRRGRSQIDPKCICRQVRGRGSLVTLPTVDRLPR